MGSSQLLVRVAASITQACPSATAATQCALVMLGTHTALSSQRTGSLLAASGAQEAPALASASGVHVMVLEEQASPWERSHSFLLGSQAAPLALSTGATQAPPEQASGAWQSFVIASQGSPWCAKAWHALSPPQKRPILHGFVAAQTSPISML